MTKKIYLSVKKIAPYKGYIYWFLTGLLLAIEGIYYSHISDYFLIVSGQWWRIPAATVHIILFLPSKIPFLPALFFIPLIFVFIYRFFRYIRFFWIFSFSLLFIIIFNFLMIHYSYNDVNTVKDIIKYRSLQSDYLFSSFISQEAKALLLDYSPSHIMLLDTKHYIDFIENLYSAGISEHLIKRLLFLRAIQSSVEEAYVQEKLDFRDNPSVEKLSVFSIEDNIFRLNHKLSYGNEILNSDGEVYACFFYHSGIITDKAKDREFFMKKALLLYKKINSSSPQIEEITLMLELEDGLKKGDKKKVKEIFDSLIKILREKGQADRALRYMEKLYNYRGDYLPLLGETSLAISSYVKDIQSRRDILNFSLKCYKEILANKNDISLYSSLAKVWFYLGEYSQAIRVYSVLSSFRSIKSDEKLLLAEAYYEENINRREALVHYIPLSDRTDFPPSCFFDMAVCYVQAGEYESALEYYKKFISFSQDDRLKGSVRRRVEILEKENENKWTGSEFKFSDNLSHEPSSLTELLEIHSDYVKTTLFMKNNLPYSLEYENDYPLYDLQYSGDVSVKITSFEKDGSPFVKLDISSFSTPSGYSYVSFKKKYIKGLTSSGLYVSLPARPEIDSFIYSVAIPATIKENNCGTFTGNDKSYNINPSDGWNIISFNRSNCRLPRDLFIPFTGMSFKDESDFTPEQWRLIGINKDREPVLFFRSFVLAFICSFLPGIILYRRKNRPVFMPLILLYYFTVINYNNPVLDYLSKNLAFPVLLFFLTVIYSLPYWLTFIYLHRPDKRKIEEIKNKLGFYPLEVVENFFLLAGEEIVSKSYFSAYDLLVIKGKSKFLKKYDIITVIIFNSLSVSTEDIKNKFPVTYNVDKVAIIISLNHLSSEHKLVLYNLKVSKKISIVSIIIDDIHTALFDEYSGKEAGGSGIRNLIRDRIFMSETEGDLYYYTQKVTDSSMFYGRREDGEKLISLIKRGINTGIFGLRKIGKSSLQMYLQKQLRKTPDIYPVIISLQRSTPSAKGIFCDILQGLKLEIKGKEPSIKIPFLKYDEKPDGSPQELARLFRDDLMSLRSIMPVSARVILFIDEIDLIFPEENNRHYHNDYYAVFTVFRGLGEVDKFFMLSVQGFSSKINSVNHFPSEFSLSENPVFQFFTDVNMGNLSKTDSSELVRGIGAIIGITYREESLERIYYEAGGHPYLTRLLCSGIVTLMKDKALPVEPALVEEAAEYCIKNHKDYFSYLDELFNDEEKENFRQFQKGGTLNSSFMETLKRLDIIKIKDKNIWDVSYNLYRRWIETIT